MRLLFAATLVLALCGHVLSAEPYRITIHNAGLFWIDPDRDAEVSWNIPEHAPATLAYQVNDFNGDLILDGTARRDGRRLTATLRVPQGYHDIKFPETGQVFGLVAIPEFTGERDRFWGMHSNLNQHDPTWVRHIGFERIFARMGLGSVREGIGSLRLLAPEPGKVEFPAAYAELLAFYQQQGMEAMPLFEGAPKWMGVDNPTRELPDNVFAFARAWPGIARSYQGLGVKDIEIWNEADTALFTGNKPPDFYASLLKAAFHATRRDGLDLQIVQSGWAHSYAREAPQMERTLNVLNRNGMFGAFDASAFHYHTKYNEDQDENLFGYLDSIRRFRETLEKFGRPGARLRNTESGYAHPGAHRPPERKYAHASAVVNAFKAIESRACGLEKYYAFYLKTHREVNYFWGMLDENWTPLPSIAAYAYATHALAHSEYAGELPACDAKWSRVFRRGDQAVVVLYRPTREGIELLGQQLAVHGVDGRRLGRDTALDDLVYVVLPYAAVENKLDREGPAWELWRAARRGDTTQEAGSPLVLIRRIKADASSGRAPVSCSMDESYRPVDEELAAYAVSLSVGNPSPRERNVELVVSLEDKELARRTVSVAADGEVETAFTFDLSEALADFAPRFLTVRAKAGDDVPEAVYAMGVSREKNLAWYLKEYPRHAKLATETPDHWDGQPDKISGKLSRLVASSVDGVIRFEAKFHESVGDRWCYPVLRYPGLDLRGARGIVLRGRVAKPGATLMVVGGFGRPHAQAKWTILPADGKWRTVFVPLVDKDLDKMDAIAIGANSNTLENTFEYSDMYVVY